MKKKSKKDIKNLIQPSNSINFLSDSTDLISFSKLMLNRLLIQLVQPTDPIQFITTLLRSPS